MTKPHPRLRKLTKWLGAAVSLLLLAAWLSSTCWLVWWVTPWRPAFNLSCGEFTIIDAGELDPTMPSGGRPTPGWSLIAVPGRPQLSLRPHWNLRSAPVPTGPPARTLRYVGIPLWLPLAPILLATAIAWRLDARAHRRPRPGHCLCGYNLAGIPAAQPCPECGAPARTSPEPAR